MGVCFLKMGVSFTKMGVCFTKVGVCFRKWKFDFSKMGDCCTKMGVFFSKMAVCFTKTNVCVFGNGSLCFRKYFSIRHYGQCDLLISGCRLSPPMSAALSGYTVATVLFN